MFNLPLSKQLGVTKSIPGDWKLTELGWIFTIAIAVLGVSAAIFGKWVQTQGPRKSGFVAALCWGTGFLVGSLGISTHQLWLVYLGYGVIGGCGLGIGYITPVSTLISWFPDRRGMATGMAIMGFGGGAMIASPLSDFLMRHFASATSTGVVQTWIVLGIVYAIFMSLGAFGYRVPAQGWSPAGWVAPPARAGSLITDRNVTPWKALGTIQFWLLWVVLCFNVTAGIGVLGQASPMIQEVFKGKITPSAAAGFVGLLSLFNMAGRFFWASLSDKIGRRKATYACFFTLGTALYALVPQPGRLGSVSLFVACFCIILTMYGGGVRHRSCAYLADVFGTKYVSAVWACADRLVGRGRRRSDTGELHPPVPDRQRRPQGPGLQRDHVHHGRPAGDRALRQPRRSSRFRLNIRKRSRTSPAPRRRGQRTRKGG